MKKMMDAQDVRFAYALEEGQLNFALNGVDITVNEGEFAVILGHNGSGKSTFAKLLNALNLPTGGKVLVDGMDTADEKNTLPIRERVGMVFQNPDNQLVATVVDEDVAFGPENLGVPQPEIVERVEQSLKAVGMLEFKKRAPHMLSGGQKQRIAIAGALAMHPRAIVLDEATAMLDPKGRQEIMEIVTRLNKEEGITIVLITHFMEEAVDADQVIVLCGGLVERKGTPREVLHDRALLEKAGLLPPFAANMAMQLRDAGIPLAGECITTQELVEELCRS
ncbi:MAG: energy-coupling factor transporter ATPase [Christensenellaceae bacterium]|nr:energy-coupling factor transporter ATPase [Christensenellaceae bacterium]